MGQPDTPVLRPTAVHENLHVAGHGRGFSAPAAIHTWQETPTPLPTLRSLRVFLSENNNWEAASSELGIHRHTLRQRMARVEELTGLSVTTTEDRVIAWLALHADHII
ncbi:helix-turn-helix domain-containing protein [Streptomyces sp. JNUCC 63]